MGDIKLTQERVLEVAQSWADPRHPMYNLLLFALLHKKGKWSVNVGEDGVKSAYEIEVNGQQHREGMLLELIAKQKT